MAEKILVVGGGGREHAIIKALKKSPDCGEIWCAPGNGGISYDAKCKNIKATDVDTMVGFAVEEKFDYVVVAQDDPLALGMVDALAKAGIPAFGPDKAAARIEASKVFSKDLMKKYGIPTAKYETFDDPAKVMDYIRAEGKYPVVIKADGLALGKGVLICENEEQAAEGVKEIMLDKKFGASGNHVVVEEFLTGPEVSVLSFCDGKTVKPMVSSRDHKRALDHDEGLNTGGMGTVAPNPCYSPAIAAECMEKIFLPTVAATDAPCTGLSVIINDDHSFDKYLFYPTNPDAVMVDTTVIANAPVKFLIAGMGAALGTYFEGRASIRTESASLEGTGITRAGQARARLCYDTLREYGKQAVEACKVHAVTPALENIIEANVYLSGVGADNVNCAAAHSFYNGVT